MGIFNKKLYALIRDIIIEQGITEDSLKHISNESLHKLYNAFDDDIFDRQEVLFNTIPEWYNLPGVKSAENVDEILEALFIYAFRYVVHNYYDLLASDLAEE